jgi:spore coat polysaccharide biosynthesis predicted glycosyltransferase SpsG
MSVQANSHKVNSYGLFDSLQLDKNYGESPVPEIMITTGGADPYNCTEKLLELLLEDDKTACYRYNVIVS